MNKLWIFQSKQYFTNSEYKQIVKIIKKFLSNWVSHGILIQAKMKIIENRFIKILLSEENIPISGCAIDSMIKMIKEIDNQYPQLQLLNRNLVSYKKNNQIITVDIANLKSKIKNGDVNSNDVIYNSFVTSQREYNEKFTQKIGISWLKYI